QERKRAYLEDIIIRAGLAHVMSWEATRRMLACLPAVDDPCVYCGGQVQARGLPEERAWVCVGCGRHNPSPGVRPAGEPRPFDGSGWAAAEERARLNGLTGLSDVELALRYFESLDKRKSAA